MSVEISSFIGSFFAPDSEYSLSDKADFVGLVSEDYLKGLALPGEIDVLRAAKGAAVQGAPIELYVLGQNGDSATYSRDIDQIEIDEYKRILNAPLPDASVSLAQVSGLGQWGIASESSGFLIHHLGDFELVLVAAKHSAERGKLRSLMESYFVPASSLREYLQMFYDEPERADAAAAVIRHKFFPD